MSKVTVANVNAAATSLFRTLKRLGMVPEGAVLWVSPGSKHNGNSWGATYAHGGVNRIPLPGVDLHGAYTRALAYERLTSAVTALDAVIAHQRTTR